MRSPTCGSAFPMSARRWCCSTTPSPPTSRTVVRAAPAAHRSKRQRPPRTRWSSSPVCRKGWTPWSARTAFFCRAGTAERRSGIDPRRGHLVAGQRGGAAHTGRAGGAGEEPYHPGYRAPTVHRRKRRSHRGDAGGAHRGNRHARAVAGARRHLYRTAPIAVPKDTDADQRKLVTELMGHTSSSFLALVSALQRVWATRNALAISLLPLAWTFRTIADLRRQQYLRRRHTLPRPPVPVVVVGNITVGGTGKTPLVIWLAELLKANGYRPGIISRGSGGRADHWPQIVTALSDPHQVG